MSGSLIWHPLVAAHELRAGENIVASLLQGQELALWRSLQGQAQAWENRCPHRGVRLTLGRLVNGRLTCGYHGWEYAAGSGRCERIPAMPDIAMPGKVGVTVYPVIEARSMVWVSIDKPVSDGAALSLAPAANAQPVFTGMPPAVFCRTLAVRAALSQMRQELARRGFHHAEPCTWHGMLAHLPVIAYALDAAPGLSLLHLWCKTRPDAAAQHALFAAARRLRSDIENSA